MYEMKSFGGVQVKFHIIVTSALDGCECSVNASTDIIHVERFHLILDARMSGPYSLSGRGYPAKTVLLPGIEPSSSYCSSISRVVHRRCNCLNFC